MRGIAARESPLTVQTGGEGRYRYRNVKEAVTPLYAVFSSLLCFLVFRFQPRCLSTFCYSAIVEIGFSFVKIFHYLDTDDID